MIIISWNKCDALCYLIVILFVLKVTLLNCANATKSFTRHNSAQKNLIGDVIKPGPKTTAVRFIDLQLAICQSTKLFQQSLNFSSEIDFYTMCRTKEVK